MTPGRKDDGYGTIHTGDRACGTPRLAEGAAAGAPDPVVHDPFCPQLHPVPPCPAASRHGSGQLYGHPHDVRRFDALCPAQMAPAASRAGAGLAGAGQLGRGPGAVHLHAGVFHRLCEHAHRGRGPGHRRGRADQHDRLRDPCGAASQPGADAGDRPGHGRARGPAAARSGSAAPAGRLRDVRVRLRLGGLQPVRPQVPSRCGGHHRQLHPLRPPGPGADAGPVVAALPAGAGGGAGPVRRGPGLRPGLYPLVCAGALLQYRGRCRRPAERARDHGPGGGGLRGRGHHPAPCSAAILGGIFIVALWGQRHAVPRPDGNRCGQSADTAPRR